MAETIKLEISTPFISRVREQIQPGETLIVKGKTGGEKSRFSVNLMAGDPDFQQGLCVLHLNVRFDEKKIVLNTCDVGSWAEEERIKLPFKPDDEFDLRIRTGENQFDILADHKEIHHFKYRYPIGTVDFFAVRGEVMLDTVHWYGRNYKLPFEALFSGGCFENGQRIFVSGQPIGERFAINLLADNGDILFHFNPRFKEKQIVRNAMIDGTWGPEEREGPFPFKKNLNFDVVIVNQPYALQIYYNGDRICTFIHRTPNPREDYAKITVTGDLQLTGIEPEN